MMWEDGLWTNRIEKQGNWIDTTIQICLDICVYMLVHSKVAEFFFPQEDRLLQFHDFYFVSCFQVHLFITKNKKK